MAVCEMSWQSNSLGKQSKATIILPQGKKGPFPVLYLLHGRSDDHTNWVRFTSLERYVSDLPLIVVMPDGARGFYCDSVTNPFMRYESFIANDLIEFVDTTFQTKANRENRVIAGLSMGGYGATKLALKHPHLFGAAVGHSGVYQMYTERDQWLNEDEHREVVSILGDGLRDNDVYALAQKHAVEYSKGAHHLPALRFDCGTEDFLYEDNQRWHEHLQKLNIPHEYQEHPGTHNWEYWDAHIPQSLEFFARYLGLR
jgi:S-formylglutathione hydrolase FrmB